MKTSHGLVIDGFMRGSAASGNAPGKMNKITEASNLLSPRAASSKIKTAAQGVHQRAQRSQTLMRSAVKKPAASLNKQASSAPKQKVIESRTSHIDHGRLARVQSIDKNTKVRRFGHGVHPVAAKKHASDRRTKEAPSSAAQSTGNNTALSRPLPSLLTSVSHQQLERMLDEALTNADAHKKAMRDHSSKGLWQRIKGAPRWLTIGVTFIVVAVIGTFVAMNKVPHVAVRVAASKAHVDAKLPAYTPSGFSFAGPVSYTEGNVSIKYKANDSSNREFIISQSSSNMSSKSLVDKVVPQNTQVQTSVVNGTTVYIYGQGNDAAWVNNGIQYTVKDGANLNSDQLLKIANSL